MHLKDFHYDLPPALIARYPLPKRSASRLLYLNEKMSEPIHSQFSDILQFIEAGDLIILNDTKVIKARLHGKKVTGGQVEILVERILDDYHMLAQIRASKSPKMGEIIFLSKENKLKIIERRETFYILSYEEKTQKNLWELLQAIGEIPLPHYLNRLPDEKDNERYQTIYAKYDGSVAAPTAGLHFDAELLKNLSDKKVDMGYLTLHVGAGTFKPVRVEKIETHHMHAEYFEISKTLCEKINYAKLNKKRVIAVGTTTLRALESAARCGKITPFQGETDIFIYPGFSFQCVDILITNFHLPCSTLLMLVCAFGGYEKLMHAYQEAILKSYRFFSYGDAMWIARER